MIVPTPAGSRRRSSLPGRQLPTDVQWSVPMTVFAGLAASRIFGWLPPNISLCLFRNIFGIPCPMCGGLRAAAALLVGDFPTAWGYNPFAVIVEITGAGVGVLYAVIPRSTARSIQRRVLSTAGFVAIGIYFGVWITWWINQMTR